MRMRVWVLAMAVATPAFAQVAGPPVPVAAKATPAEQAIDQYRKRDAPRTAAPVRCRNKAGEEITVCGGVSEGARAPLPNDQRIATGTRAVAGELPSSAGIHYTNPVGLIPQTGVGATLKGGKITAGGLGQ